ncbi:MAG: response regulator [Planctomycetales bacterium]|nr:response regulator [Planctomycetales bacterium]
MATILAVDDDPAVRGLLADLLFRRGHSVLTARDGIEALERLAETQEGIACALVDWSMPRMGGKALVERIRFLRPGLPVVLMTGSVADEAFHEVEAEARLRKPFTISEAVAAVHRVLAAAPADETGAEKRRHPRREVSLPVEVHRVPRETGPAARARARNLSRGGVQLQLGLAGTGGTGVASGETVESVLFVPGRPEVRVRSRVVWRAPARGATGERLGLEFLEPAEAVAALL